MLTKVRQSADTTALQRGRRGKGLHRFVVALFCLTWLTSVTGILFSEHTLTLSSQEEVVEAENGAGNG